jgi:hypothetical protein
LHEWEAELLIILFIVIELAKEFLKRDSSEIAKSIFVETNISSILLGKHLVKEEVMSREYTQEQNFEVINIDSFSNGSLINLDQSLSHLEVILTIVELNSEAAELSLDDILVFFGASLVFDAQLSVRESLLIFAEKSLKCRTHLVLVLFVVIQGVGSLIEELLHGNIS